MFTSKFATPTLFTKASKSKAVVSFTFNSPVLISILIAAFTISLFVSDIV